MQRFKLASAGLGVFAPDSLTTAAGDNHLGNTAGSDCRQIIFFQAFVLATEAEVEGIKAAAFFLFAEKDKIFAHLLYDLSERDRAAPTARTIRRTAGEKQGARVGLAQFLEPKPLGPSGPVDLWLRPRVVMLAQTFVNRSMRLDRTFLLGDLLAHGHGDFPGSITVVAHAAKFLAHQAIRAGVDDFFELRRNRIQTVKNPLRHQPARLRRVTLEAIKLIGGTLLFRSHHIFHWI